MFPDIAAKEMLQTKSTHPMYELEQVPAKFQANVFISSSSEFRKCCSANAEACVNSEKKHAQIAIRLQIIGVALGF